MCFFKGTSLGGNNVAVVPNLPSLLPGHSANGNVPASLAIRSCLSPDQ